MDVFYEESSTPSNSVQEAKKYKIFHVISVVCLTLGIAGTIFALNVPLELWLLWFSFVIWFYVGWFICFKLKARYNVSYDYSFVSGELRIAKVANINKRKQLACIQAEGIIQLGDVETGAFEGFQVDPNVQTLVYAANETPVEGKFFLYILTIDNGKKLYVLECKEELLLNVMKFAKRSALEREYVPQEKKRKV